MIKAPLNTLKKSLLIGGMICCVAMSAAVAGPGDWRHGDRSAPAIAQRPDAPDRADHRQDLRYDRRSHGERYRQRRHGYEHYHDGYYYSVPWWLTPWGIGAAISGPPVAHHGGWGRKHVKWCSRNHRYYDPGNNTYMGPDGRRYYCNSPFN